MDLTYYYVKLLFYIASLLQQHKILFKYFLTVNICGMIQVILKRILVLLVPNDVLLFLINYQLVYQN